MQKKIKFKSFDGTNLVGIYTTLNSQTKEKINAAFLMVHGLPSNKDEWGFYKDMSEYFLENNYASFRFDFRYNGESQEGSFQNLTISSLINDIESAYWQLRNLVGETTKIFVVGTSCGGGVTVKWLNTFKRDVQKLFLMAPVLDYVYEVTGKLRTYSEKKFSPLAKEIINKMEINGTLNDDIGYGIEMLNESNIFNIKDEFGMCKIPIHIFQGNDDSIVPISITKENIKGFENIELVQIDKADHGFAVEGDDDLTDPLTKENHFYVYKEILKRI